MRHTDEFIADRTTRRGQITVNANKAEVFPLLCPVREAEWLVDWNYRMVYSDCGLAERGCVFLSMAPEEADTIWLITQLDAAAGHIQFARITPESRVTMAEFTVQEISHDRCIVSVCYTVTGLNEPGNLHIKQLTESAFAESMQFWELAINHYIDTGERLEPSNEQNH